MSDVPRYQQSAGILGLLMWFIGLVPMIPSILVGMVSPWGWVLPVLAFVDLLHLRRRFLLRKQYHPLVNALLVLVNVAAVGVVAGLSDGAAPTFWFCAAGAICPIAFSTTRLARVG